MRFEYDPPSPLMLVAGSGNGLFYDKSLKQVGYFPLSSTPLGILLSENLKLAGEVTVSAYVGTIVTASGALAFVEKSSPSTASARIVCVAAIVIGPV
jgi:hypothetical protein